MNWILRILLLSLLQKKSAGNMEINIIIVILGEDINYGYFATAPMYDYAFLQIAANYPDQLLNTSVNFHYEPNVANCAEAGANINYVAAKMFDIIDKKRGFTVLFTPGCSLEVIPLADFAREMNVLLLASTSSDVSFANNLRFPTFVSFGPTGQGGLVPSLKSFLRKFSWTTLTVFCESPYNYLNIAPFFGLTCRSIKSMLVAASNEFTVFYEDFNSQNNQTDFRSMLLRAKSQSRVIVVESRQDVVRKIMITAYMLNMRADEFVFIYPEPDRTPFYVSLLQKTDDINDELAVEAFASLIVVHFDHRNWSKTVHVFKAVFELAQRKYNYTYTQDELMINSNALAAYEMATVFSTVVREILDVVESDLTISNVKKHLLNRTFNLDTQPVTISSTSFRLTDILYSRFNKTSGVFQPTWSYLSAPNRFEQVSGLADDWNGNLNAPLNKPGCGYLGELCYGQHGHVQRVVLAVFGVLAAAIVVAVILVYGQRAWAESPPSWLLDSSLFTPKKPQMSNASSTVNYFLLNRT